MTAAVHPVAARAVHVPASESRTLLPEPFVSMVKGRTRRPLGDYFGLQTFGVNLVRLTPGSGLTFTHKDGTPY